MPEYLAPGVYVEATPLRATAITGVATSVAGMVGVTRYGPVSYPARVRGTDETILASPRLVASFADFERTFGGLGPVDVGGSEQIDYLAHAARAFFDNGGCRLYVSRVFPMPSDAIEATRHFATRDVGGVGTWRAQWPGSAGRTISVSVGFTRSDNVIIDRGGTPTLAEVLPGALVETWTGAAAPAEDVPPVREHLEVVARAENGVLGFDDGAGGVTAPSGSGSHVQLTVTVRFEGRSHIHAELAVASHHPRSVLAALDPLRPADPDAMVWLDADPATSAEVAELATALLDGANQGVLDPPAAPDPAVNVAALEGREADPDDDDLPALGLAALGEIDEISIVTIPEAARFTGGESIAAAEALITHCETHRHRFAIVDPPAERSTSEVLRFRSHFESDHAALYYPWVETIDPTRRAEPGAPPPTLMLPPSGFVAGIYARTDVERGVHKAPANEVVNGMIRFETDVTADRLALLHHEGVNVLRSVTGRSNRVWGARTMSSDPERRYVNVRRLLTYFEHSIERSIRWVVFEPNTPQLWANVRRTIEDFLHRAWTTGALMGTTSEQAFVVRCDRGTMTQSDLDDGRLICLVGVAPTRPAEFVLFRIGQWTVDAHER